jgi:hypothetical protein
MLGQRELPRIETTLKLHRFISQVSHGAFIENAAMQH